MIFSVRGLLGDFLFLSVFDWFGSSGCWTVLISFRYLLGIFIILCFIVSVVRVIGIAVGLWRCFVSCLAGLPSWLALVSLVFMGSMAISLFESRILLLTQLTFFSKSRLFIFFISFWRFSPHTCFSISSLLLSIALFSRSPISILRLIIAVSCCPLINLISAVVPSSLLIA